MFHKLFLHKYLKELAVLIIFALIVAIFYGNTLQNGFVFDDNGQIEGNADIKSLRNLPKVISGCVWESFHGSCKGGHYYRPMQALSYLLTYQISPEPRVFHLVNIIYFTADIFLIFVLVKLLTKNFLIGFISALIFLIHPINSEVVNWAATVPDLLCTAFLLLSTIFYFLYRTRKKQNYLTFVYIFYAFGVFSKEQAVLLPLIFLLLDLLYFKKKIPELLSWKSIKQYLVYVAIISIYMGLRFWVLGGFGGIESTEKLTFIDRIYIFFNLWSMHVQKLFYPWPLNIYHLFQLSYQPLGVLLTFSVVAAYIGLGLAAWKRKWFLVIFGLVWFLLFLSPGLIFLNPENPFAERYIFTSGVGFSLLAAMLLNWLRGINRNMQIGVIGLVGITVLISFMVIYQRNTVWQNNISIYTDTLKKSPGADRIRYNLALNYMSQGDIPRVKELLTEIIKRGKWADQYLPYNNLGEFARREGRYDQAISNFQASIELNPNQKEIYNNIGMLYLEQGNLLQSLPFLCKALTLDPNFKDAGNNLSIASSQVQSLDNKSFISLYDQMLNGDVFKSNRDQEITLEKKDCSYTQGCILIFSSKLPNNEFFLPFLTMGKTDNGEVVRSRYFEFNPQTSEIAIGIDREFESSNINFYIPTCEGVYYETATK